MWLGGIGLLIASGGVWLSGSRTAFLALVVGVTLIVVPACRRLASPDTRPLPFVLGAVALVVFLAFAALVFVPLTGPGERIREMVPPASVDGAQRLVRTLWNRGWYGPAAHLMIRDHPVVGVGVGAFHPLVGQYARLAGHRAAFDNAQNWYRHQLAELGLVGSIPWILWVIFFSGIPAADPRRRRTAVSGRGRQGDARGARQRVHSRRARPEPGSCPDVLDLGVLVHPAGRWSSAACRHDGASCQQAAGLDRRTRDGGRARGRHVPGSSRRPPSAVPVDAVAVAVRVWHRECGRCGNRGRAPLDGEESGVQPCLSTGAGAGAGCG